MFNATVPIETLKPGEKIGYELNGTKLLIANVNGNIYAVEQSCTHEETNLAEGNLEGCIIECPLHGAMFDITDGKVVSLPATVPLKTYPAKIENGMIFIDTDV
jgi:3-phenylpropionate/trans-cinnamate dioxygenase ferredoxin subunit/naphthalene 1,2-dioxygenase system ferredoxin subunit